MRTTRASSWWPRSFFQPGPIGRSITSCRANCAGSLRPANAYARLWAGRIARIGYCVRLENRLAENRRLKPLLGVVDAQLAVEPFDAAADRVDGRLLPVSAGGRFSKPWCRPGFAARRAPGKRSLSRSPITSPRGSRSSNSAPTQRRILNYLVGRSDPVPIRQLAEAAGCTTAPIQALRKKGLLEFESRRVDSGHLPAKATTAPEPHLDLNADSAARLSTRFFQPCTPASMPPCCCTASPAAARPKSTSRPSRK